MQNRKKKIVGGIVAAFVVLGIGSAVAGGSDNPSAAKHSAVAKQAKGNDSASHPAKTKPTASPTPDIQFTVEQRNAIHSAKEYLSMQGFSKAGLVGQLSSKYGDQYPKPVAVFAVNHLDVDWNKQAVRSAKEYLSMSGFSRQGLIDQLSSKYGDKYTEAQAVYAANHVGL